MDKEEFRKIVSNKINWFGLLIPFIVKGVQILIEKLNKKENKCEDCQIYINNRKLKSNCQGCPNWEKER